MQIDEKEYWSLKAEVDKFHHWQYLGASLYILFIIGLLVWGILGSFGIFLF